MRVRFLIKVNSKLGLVQEQKATIVDFVFHQEDRARYNLAAPGELFRPRYLPAGIWLEVDDFNESPIWVEALDMLCAGNVESAGSERVDTAKSLMLFSPVEAEFKWVSSVTHTVKRTGFALTHAYYLSSTACQGQTLRAGVTIDCARMEPQGRQGTKDAEWWLHLYVMFSRATCMEDMLLLRPPSREFLERGPPASVKAALEQFAEKIRRTSDAAVAFAAAIGMVLPAES